MMKMASLAALTALMIGTVGSAFAAPNTAQPIEPVQVQAADPVATPSGSTDVSPAEAKAKERELGKFGAWSAVCFEGSEPDSCIARQTVEMSEDGKGPKLYLFAEQANADAPVSFTVGAPPGVSLRPGAFLLLNKDDKAAVWQADFDNCIEESCWGASPLNTDILTLAETPAISLTLPTGQGINVQVEMKTLPEAMKAVLAEKAKFPAAPAAEQVEDGDTPTPAPETAPAPAN